MNLHGGGLPTSTALLALFSGWLPFSSKQESSGYHHSTDKGQAVLQIASTLRYVMCKIVVSGFFGGNNLVLILWGLLF